MRAWERAYKKEHGVVPARMDKDDAPEYLAWEAELKACRAELHAKWAAHKLRMRGWERTFKQLHGHAAGPADKGEDAECTRLQRELQKSEEMLRMIGPYDDQGSSFADQVHAAKERRDVDRRRSVAALERRSRSSLSDPDAADTGAAPIAPAASPAAAAAQAPAVCVSAPASVSVAPPAAAPEEERRYDPSFPSDGPFTEGEFLKYYAGSTAEWDAATSQPVTEPLSLVLTRIGPRGLLGMSVAATSDGLHVGNVTHGGSAAECGLMRGDRVTTIDGVTVAASSTLPELFPPDRDRFHLEVRRPVVSTARQAGANAPASDCAAPTARAPGRQLPNGLAAEPLSLVLTRLVAEGPLGLTIVATASGLHVGSVADRGAAERSGLMPDDCVTNIDGVSVTASSTLSELFPPERERFTVEIRRPVATSPASDGAATSAASPEPSLRSGFGGNGGAGYGKPWEPAVQSAGLVANLSPTGRLLNIDTAAANAEVSRIESSSTATRTAARRQLSARWREAKRESDGLRQQKMDTVKQSARDHVTSLAKSSVELPSARTYFSNATSPPSFRGGDYLSSRSMGQRRNSSRSDTSSARASPAPPLQSAATTASTLPKPSDRTNADVHPPTTIAAAVRVQRWARRRRRRLAWLEMVQDLKDWEVLQSQLRAARTVAAAAIVAAGAVPPTTIVAAVRVQRWARRRRRRLAWLEMVQDLKDWEVLQSQLRAARAATAAATAAAAEAEPLVVCVAELALPLGIGLDDSNVVHQVNPGSGVECGLKCGDRIIYVDGVDLRAGKEDVASALNRELPTHTIVWQRNAAAEDNKTYHVIHIKPIDGTLGLGLTDTNIVGDMVEGGAAAKAGTLKRGDELMLVDGIDVRGGKIKLGDVLDKARTEHEFILARILPARG